MKELDKHKYLSKHGLRVRLAEAEFTISLARNYILECTPMGYGDDPVRFLIASHRALIAQVAELKKDAERYQWLKKNANIDFDTGAKSMYQTRLTVDSLDAAIDAAKEGK